MTLESWAILIAVGAALLALIAKAMLARTRDFEQELRRELALHGAVLVSIRVPRPGEKSPFPIFSLDLGELASWNRDTSTSTRVVTIRLPDGTEHQTWAQIDIDHARAAVGLDLLQIEFSPAISELKRQGNRSTSVPASAPRQKIDHRAINR